MSSSMHTPGPWSLGEPPYHVYVFGSDGFDLAETQGYGCIHREFYARRMGDGHWATTPGSNIERDAVVQEANARLIAAAPDMLDALKAYSEYAALPTDRGGRGGPKGVAHARFLALKDAALRLAETGERS